MRVELHEPQEGPEVDKFNDGSEKRAAQDSLYQPRSWPQPVSEQEAYSGNGLAELV